MTSEKIRRLLHIFKHITDNNMFKRCKKWAAQRFRNYK